MDCKIEFSKDFTQPSILNTFNMIYPTKKVIALI